MTKEDAIAYCYRHQDEYIRDAHSIDEGVQQFDCLVSLLKNDTITPDKLSDYWMEYDEPNVSREA